jgi:hypothetical protein
MKKYAPLKELEILRKRRLSEVILYKEDYYKIKTPMQGMKKSKKAEQTTSGFSLNMWKKFEKHPLLFVHVAEVYGTSHQPPLSPKSS